MQSQRIVAVCPVYNGPNKTYSIAYCRIEDEMCCESKGCCSLRNYYHRLALWETWYFWFGLVLLFLFVLTTIVSYVIAAHRKQCQVIHIRTGNLGPFAPTASMITAITGPGGIIQPKVYYEDAYEDEDNNTRHHGQKKRKMKRKKKDHHEKKRKKEIGECMENKDSTEEKMTMENCAPTLNCPTDTNQDQFPIQIIVSKSSDPTTITTTNDQPTVNEPIEHKEPEEQRGASAEATNENEEESDSSDDTTDSESTVTEEKGIEESIVVSPLSPAYPVFQPLWALGNRNNYTTPSSSHNVLEFTLPPGYVNTDPNGSKSLLRGMRNNVRPRRPDRRYNHNRGW